MGDVVGLLASCGQILGGIITVIEHSTKAWDRTKNGTKYLQGVCDQVQATKLILANVVGNSDRLQGERRELIRTAVNLVVDKATALQQAAESLAAAKGESGFKVFLGELVLGDARAKAFDKLQADLLQAQTTLILSLVEVREGKTVYINLITVNQVNQCFGKHEEVNYARKIIDLVRTRGQPMDKNPESIWWQVPEDDWDAILGPPSQGGTVRIISNNVLTDYSFASADVGKRGEEAPHIDKVVAEGNKLSGHAYMVAGSLTFETSAEMQILRAALSEVQGKPDTAERIIFDVLRKR